jgi:uncharacterized protein DUF6854
MLETLTLNREQAMAIVTVSRWKGNQEQTLPLAREAAPILKKHGATSVRVGPCFAGPDAGQTYVAVTFPDWAAFGRAQQALSTDAQWRSLYAQASKVGELQDRSIIMAEEL